MIFQLRHDRVVRPTADNTAYTLRAYALALRDIAPFGRNVVYAGNVRRNGGFKYCKTFEVIII